MENQFNPNRSEKTNESKKSGKTFKSKSRDSKVGEYIDYEEID